MADDEWHNGNSYWALKELFRLARIGEGCFESLVCSNFLFFSCFFGL